ncbi:MAG: transporter associated domain-containing protein, partial [Dermabacter sp.]|nr:transporter associated domain-containing protein [Dermabacter sp.]
QGGIDEWTLSGLMRPDEIRRDMGVIVPESPDYETLGGLIMDRLERLPRVGDVVEVPGVRFAVTALDGRRVDTVDMKLLSDEARARVDDEEGDDHE